MVRYKKLGGKLAVKGLNSKRVLAFNIVIFVLLCVMLFLTVVASRIEGGDGVFITFILISTLMLAAQFLFIHGYVKTLKKIIVFNKTRGLIEFYEGDRYTKYFFGKASYWYIQQVLHKNQRKKFHDYHVILVGSRGKKYIGLSALTQKGVIKKMRKLNEYFQIDFVFSQTSISGHEAVRQLQK